jgi:hypothetical protein
MELYIFILVFVALLMLGCAIYHWRTVGKINLLSKDQLIDKITTVPSLIKKESIEGVVKLLPDSVTYEIIKEASKHAPVDELKQKEKIDDLMKNKIQISELSGNSGDNSIELPWDDIPDEDKNSGLPYGEKYKNKYEILNKNSSQDNSLNLTATIY